MTPPDPPKKARLAAVDPEEPTTPTGGSPPERDALIEAVTTAYRERSPHGQIRWSQAWHDLDEADRDEAFKRTMTNRRLEAALDPEGLSSTAKAVLARITKR